MSNNKSMSNVLMPKILSFGFWISFVIWILAFGIAVSEADAAEFRLESEDATFGAGNEFLVTLTIDTEGEAVNAFEGRVVFPEDLVGLKGIQEQGSIVNFWVKEPKAGTVPAFSGLTPGGYTGEGVLFSLIFEAKAEGEGNITIENGKALLNDGEGTPAELEIFNYQFSIINQDTNSQAQRITMDDTEAPEPFELKTGQDPNAFDGQPFLVFAARDKNSGVDHYEISFVSNGRQTVFARAESPFSLAGYSGIDEILVKAVDRAGNERIATLALGTKSSFLVFLLWGNAGILIGIGIVLIFLLWRKKMIVKIQSSNGK